MKKNSTRSFSTSLVWEEGDVLFLFISSEVIG